MKPIIENCDSQKDSTINTVIFKRWPGRYYIYLRRIPSGKQFKASYWLFNLKKCQRNN